MKFEDKYRHVGYSYPSVPTPWKPIVKKAIVEIEKKMWFKYMPMFLKRLIFKLATGNSVYRIKSKFWYWIYNKLSENVIVQIKDKFASLCIYMSYTDDEIEKIIRDAEETCEHVCEACGRKRTELPIPVTNVRGWYRRICPWCKFERGIDPTDSEYDSYEGYYQP